MHVSYMCLSEAQSELITFVKKSRNPEILPKFPNFFLYSQKFPKKGQFQAISPTYPIIPRIGIWKSQIGNPGAREATTDKASRKAEGQNSEASKNKEGGKRLSALFALFLWR